MVTRFECPTARALLMIVLLHLRVGPSVRKRTTGLLGIKMFIRWRERVLYNVSLWSEFDDIYSMGNVPLHVAATRLTAKFGVRTACGIYDCAGDWRSLMFGGVGDELPLGVIP